MKKFVYMTLAALLTMSFSMTTTYAGKNGNEKFTESGKGKVRVEKEESKKDKEEKEEKEVKIELKITLPDTTSTGGQATVTESVYDKKDHWKNNPKIEDLRQELKEYHKNKEKRKELIKEIVKLRKEIKNDSIPVFIKGNELETDVPPVIKDGRTLIPVRAVTNSLGAEVDWSAETRTVTVTKAVYGDAGTSKTISIQIKLDSDVVLVDGQEVKIDVPAQIISQRTMIPLRFIAETFKQKVEWDEATGSVIIEDQE